MWNNNGNDKRSSNSNSRALVMRDAKMKRVATPEEMAKDMLVLLPKHPIEFLTEELTTGRPSECTKTMAKALLAMIPEGSTVHSAEVKRFQKAVCLVKDELVRDDTAQKAIVVRAVKIVDKELANRTKKLSGQVKSQGEKSHILMSGISVPSEVLLRVFGFLTRNTVLLQVALVSKAFSVETQKCQWAELSFNERSMLVQKLNMTKLLGILKYHSELQHLKVPNGGIKFGPLGFTKLVQACPHLTSIDLSEVIMNLTQLRALAKSFPNLSCLRLGLQDSRSYSDSLKLLKAIGTQLRKLSFVVRCKFCLAKMKIEEADSIANACPALESFECTGTFCLYLDPVILHLLRACTNLHTLKLRNLDPSTVEQISQMPHRLTTFEVTDITRVVYHAPTPTFSRNRSI